MKNKITIRDIARQCGTSISTVSRVINGSAGVEAKLKANVLSAIQECDWQSNNLRLKFSRKSKVKPYVVVVSSFRGRSPDLSAVAPVSKLCAECDFKDLYFFSCDSQTMEFCRCVNPYALILISSVGSRRIEVEKLIESGTRVLYLGHGEIEPHKGASCYVPIGEFIRYSVDLLHQMGHTKIGYFGQFGEYAHFSGANHHSPRQNDAVETLRSLIPGFNVRNDTVGDCSDCAFRRISPFLLSRVLKFLRRGSPRSRRRQNSWKRSFAIFCFPIPTRNNRLPCVPDCGIPAGLWLLRPPTSDCGKPDGRDPLCFGTLDFSFFYGTVSP